MEAKQSLVKEICPTTTQSWLKNGALLLDVREKDEVEELAYDVSDLIHIPLSEFELRYNEVPKDRDVIVACKGGGRSLRAAGFLINHGYSSERVVNMQHGMMRWAQKGFPTKGNLRPYINLDQNKDNSCCSPNTNQSTKNTCCDSPNSHGTTCC